MLGVGATAACGDGHIACAGDNRVKSNKNTSSLHLSKIHPKYTCVKFTQNTQVLL